MIKLADKEKEFLNFIKKRNGVGFCDIEDFFEENDIDYKGDYDYILSDYNIVIWFNFNKETIEELIKLQKENKIIIDYGSKEEIAFVSMCNMKYLINLPIATKKTYYKKPHYLPTIIKIPKKQQIIKNDTL